jgi:hypothetical protein
VRFTNKWFALFRYAVTFGHITRFRRTLSKEPRYFAVELMTTT